MSAAPQPPAIPFSTNRQQFLPKLRAQGKCLVAGNFTAYGGGTDTTYRARQAFPTGPSPICGVAIELGQWLMNAGNVQNSASANAVTYTASVEYPIGTILGVITWNGQQSVALNPGATVRSDVCDVYIPPNVIPYIRIFGSFAAGGTVPGSWFPERTVYPGECSQVGVGLADNTQIPSDPYTGYGLQAGYGCTGIFTYQTNPTPSICVIGDSLSLGVGDDPTGLAGFPTGDGYFNFGFIQRAFSAAGIACQKFTKSGMCGYNMIGSGGSYATLWDQSLSGHSSATILFGTNDLTISGVLAANVIATLTELYNRCASRGLRVVPITLPPRTTGTFTAAGGAGQTAYLGSYNANAFAYGANSDRALINAFIRSAPQNFPNIAGIIDFANCVEPTQNCGYWGLTPGGLPTTTGGTHPNQNALPQLEALVAQAIASGVVA